MSSNATAKSEIAFAIVLIAFSGLIYLGTADLPPPKFEPLGSAALPRALSGIMALLSLIMMGRAVYQLKRSKAEAKPKPNAIKSHNMLSLGVFVATLVFVAVMDFGLLGFNIAGIIFLTFVAWLMTHRDMRKLPWIAGYAVVMITACTYVFTKFFYINLP